jgi:hypothetical protein
MNWHKLRVLTLIKRFARYIKIGFWSGSSLSLSLRIIKSSSSKLLGLGDERAPWKRTAQIAATNSIFLCVRYIITNRFSHSDETQLQFNDIQLIRYIFKNIFKLKKINWITFSLPEFGNAFWKLKKRRLGELLLADGLSMKLVKLYLTFIRDALFIRFEICNMIACFNVKLMFI